MRRNIEFAQWWPESTSGESFQRLIQRGLKSRKLSEARLRRQRYGAQCLEANWLNAAHRENDVLQLDAF